MGKNKKGGQKSKSKTSKPSSKTQQVFKAGSTNNKKKGNKKTKEIPKKLKQLDIKTKDKADQQLKDLHVKMVSKKELKPSKAVGKKKGPAPSTEKVEDGLDKMNVK